MRWWIVLATAGALGCAPAEQAAPPQAPELAPVGPGPSETTGVPPGAAPVQTVAPSAAPETAGPAPCPGDRPRGANGRCRCKFNFRWNEAEGRCDTHVGPRVDPRPCPNVAGGHIPNACEMIKAVRPQLRGCYDAALEDHPALQGSAQLTAIVGADGRVTKVSGGSTGRLGVISSCLKDVVAGMQFDPPDGDGAVVSIPVSFVAGE